MNERAAPLGERPGLPAVDTEWQLEALIFEVSGSRFALPTRDVTEVVRAVAIAPLPKAPAIVEGIINVRGQILPVLDLRARFRLQPSALQTSDHFVVAAAGERRVALRVDRALAMIPLQALRTKDALHLPAGVEHVAGVAYVEGEIVLIHDLRAFLSEAESYALDAALTDVEPRAEAAR